MPILPKWVPALENAGGILVLIAFVLNVMGYVAVTNWFYLALNAVGCSALIYSGVKRKLPIYALMNVAWAGFSVFQLGRAVLKVIAPIV